MAHAHESWPTQQLVEFLAVVSACSDLGLARRTAVERAAEAVEADVGALVQDGAVLATTGFSAEDVPAAAIVAAATQRTGELELPWGTCRTRNVPVHADGSARMLLGRLGEEGFSTEEIALMRGMARVLAVSCRGIELVEELEERQSLFARLARIQRSIVQRAELQDVLEAIVGGAQELLGDEMITLRLVDPDDRGTMVMVASRGIADELLQRTRRVPVGSGAGGRAVVEDRLIVVGDYGAFAGAHEALGGAAHAVLAAPVHENGEPIGSLVVASADPARRHSATEQETLLAFAEHASLALTDARNYESAVRQALYDGLTGLANRALFRDHLAQAQARARRDGRAPSVLFVDVDNFKSVNDSLGHAAGDELLREVARRLRANIREQDLAARLGGDEFAVLVPATGEEGAGRAAQRILNACRQPFAVGGRRLRVSVSVGVASGTEEPDELVRHADLAMYEAKAAGKDGVESYAPRMQVAAVRRLELEADLREAIARDELFLQFQPLVRLATDRVAGVEALVRWRHPRRGVVPPCDFIPLAEQTGLIHPIGRWVLQQACAQAAAWAGRFPELGMGVNISARQLADPGFHAELQDVLATTGLPPRTLVLELTETALMHDVEASIQQLCRAKELGVQVAVDDFGTGYSSLQYLLRLPLDVLKMTRAFVERIDGPAHEQAIGRTILDLGRSLGLSVVGEGIERPGQLHRLRELGCSLGQGFLLARPMDAPALERLLEAEDGPLALSA